MTNDDLTNLVKRHEGSKKNKAGRHIHYQCSANKWTVGYGRNLDTGFSEDEALLMLQNDIKQAQADVKTLMPYIATFAKIYTPRYCAFVDMMLNIGITRMKQFKKMLAAAAAGNWKQAAKEILNSKYAKDVGDRAKEIAYLVEYNEELKGVNDAS